MQKKATKTLLSILLAIVFAFSPLLFSGCKVDVDDGEDSTSGDTIPSNFKMSDYLSGVKVSYQIGNLSSAVENENIRTYANQVINFAELLSMETIAELLKQYATDIILTETKSSGSISIDIAQSVVPFSQDVAITIDLENPTIYEYNNYTMSNNQLFSFKNLVKQWESCANKQIQYTTFNEYFNYIMERSDYTNKMSYAVLAIVDKFYDATEQNFEQRYQEFKTQYESITDYDAERTKLSFNVKHSGIIAGSLEEQAFARFVLDYIIGTDLVSQDNQLFQVFDTAQQDYVDISDYAYSNRVDEATVKFEGETYYYNPDAIQSEATTKDISLYINNNPSNVVENLEYIYNYENTNKKLWQDIYSRQDETLPLTQQTQTNKPNIETIDYLTGGIQTSAPKYRPLPGFRNYEYTTKTIVNNILSYTAIESAGNETIHTYPTTANVFSKDYTYTSVEVKGNSDDDSTSCKLPKYAYKSVMLCTKDRTLEEVKNSLGSVYMLLESSEGVEVNVSLFARYYRTNGGYAQFDTNTTNQNGEKVFTTFYDLGCSGTVDGPYSIDFENQNQDGSFKEGCLFELEFTGMFEKALFGESYTPYNKTFDFAYTDEGSGEQKTAKIYELEPFPANYFNPSYYTTNVGHATIIGTNNPIANPVYEVIESPKTDTQDTNGGKLFSFSSDNIKEQYLEENKDYAYIEIMFVTSNNNPFTFGFTGYIPQTEDLDEYSGLY